MVKFLRFFIPVFFAAISLVASAATTASDILDAMRAKMVSAKTVEVKFTMPGADGPVQGDATVAGALFVFHTPQMSVWYDGKTQWALLRSTGEVSITEPTAEELNASNPFAILNSYHHKYKARRLSDSNGRYRVELIPLSKASMISKIVVFCDMKTKWPAAISVTFDDDRRIDLTVDSIKAAPAVPESTFRYDRKRYPASEIIDLR